MVGEWLVAGEKEASGREDEQQRKEQSDAQASCYGDSGQTGTRRSAPRYDRCAITRGERLSLTRGTEAFPHSWRGAAFAMSPSPCVRGEGTQIETPLRQPLDTIAARSLDRKSTRLNSSH